MTWILAPFFMAVCAEFTVCVPRALQLSFSGIEVKYVSILIYLIPGSSPPKSPFSTMTSVATATAAAAAPGHAGSSSITKASVLNMPREEGDGAVVSSEFYQFILSYIKQFFFFIFLIAVSLLCSADDNFSLRRRWYFSCYYAWCTTRETNPDFHEQRFLTVSKLKVH